MVSLRLTTRVRTGRTAAYLAAVDEKGKGELLVLTFGESSI